MQAVIFDMDGLLIDSEPMWKAAEHRVFSSVGVDVCEQLSAQTAAMTTDEVTRFWYEQNPWTGKSLAQVETEVVDCVEALITERGMPLDGVIEILSFFQQRGFKIGLSTNSPARLIPVVLNKLDISAYFDAISSSEHEVAGKPHPAVYLSTAKKMGVSPSLCLAFEDSVSGIVSAVDAGLKVVAVPPAESFGEDRYNGADMIIRKLSDFSGDHLGMITRDV